MWTTDRKIAKREGMRIQKEKDSQNMRRYNCLISHLASLGDLKTIQKVTAPKPEIDINALYEKFHIE